MSGIGKSIGLDIVTKTGGVQPFVNVSINGLLWGYPGSDVSTFENLLSLILLPELEMKGHFQVLSKKREIKSHT